MIVFLQSHLSNYAIVCSCCKANAELGTHGKPLRRYLLNATFNAADSFVSHVRPLLVYCSPPRQRVRVIARCSPHVSMNRELIN